MSAHSKDKLWIFTNRKFVLNITTFSFKCFKKEKKNEMLKGIITFKHNDVKQKH